MSMFLGYFVALVIAAAVGIAGVYAVCTIVYRWPRSLIWVVLALCAVVAALQAGATA